MGTTQIIYAVLALAVIGLMTLLMNRGQQTALFQMYQNEMLTQVSGVATEILEDIGTHPFDHWTENGKGWDENEAPVDPTDLTATNHGEWGQACTIFVDCDIDDFDRPGEVTFTKDRFGVTYDVETTVRYVDEDNPTIDSANQTWMKEVTVNITSPDIYERGSPDSLIVVSMSRVFTYFKTQLPDL